MNTKIQPDLKPAQMLNVVDRVVTFFDPAAGRQRMIDRAILNQFGYNDVPQRRGRARSLIASANSETWNANRDRLKMMEDAREAATFDWIGGVLAKVVLYVAGHIHCKSATGEDEVDQAYDDYFHGWCGDERDESGLTRCDITGRARFSKQVQMSFLAMLVDGDYGFVEIDPLLSPTVQLDEAGQPIPGTGEFCIQGVEADRIGSPIESSTIENYIGGITLDPKTGRIISYRTYRRTRTNQYVDKQEVPVENFIHVVDHNRSDEYRGRSYLLRVLNDLRDIKEWIEAEKIAGKTQSQWAALIGTKDPYSQTGPAAWTDKLADGTPTQDAQWGKMLKIAEGDSFSMLAPSSRPSGAFMSFVQMLIRKMSIALNLPYGFLWDLATLGGVTARIEVQGALRQIQYWQENVLVNLILDRVREKVLSEGISKGLIPPHPLWKKCTWHFGPWISTDVSYEMDVDSEGLRLGIFEVEEVCAKRGKSARDIFRSNGNVANTAINVGTEVGLPAEAFAAGLYPQLTNQKAAYNTPTPIPPPPAGSFDAVGDKGVAKIIEMLQSVKDGKMDHDSVVASLQKIFGMSKKSAEDITPDNPTKAETEALHPKPVAPGGAGGKSIKTSSSKKRPAKKSK